MAATSTVSETFDASRWRQIPGFEGLTDITYHRGLDTPAVRVAFNRPDVRNAFRPHTVDELYQVLDHARMSADVAAVLLCGNGPSPKDGGWAFCSGGDQRIRGRDGYLYEADAGTDRSNADAGTGRLSLSKPAQVDAGTDRSNADAGTGRLSLSKPAQVDASADAAASTEAGAAPVTGTAAAARMGRLHILEVQRLMRTMPKVVIAVVDGWAAGGGHSLHVVADLSIACRQHARFMQTDANVGSFDGGYGSALLARQVGQKRAREIFFLAREYSAEQAERWGAVNEVADHADLENLGLQYAATIAGKSPQAIRMLKFAFNLADDGLAGQQVFAGEATRLAYMTDEAVEGRDAFLQRRDPNWTSFPYYY